MLSNVNVLSNSLVSPYSYKQAVAVSHPSHKSFQTVPI